MMVLSLCDRTGVMVHPWLEAGYDCVIGDLGHPRGLARDGRLTTVGVNVSEFQPWWRTTAIVFAFPPCTHLAASGARWFEDKGLEAFDGALGLVIACKRICEQSGAPWMIENPVGMLSSYWRKPDYTFQPWEYGDRYTKKTCLWTGNGFRMPAAWQRTKPSEVEPLIHLMPPSA